MGALVDREKLDIHVIYHGQTYHAQSSLPRCRCGFLACKAFLISNSCAFTTYLLFAFGSGCRQPHGTSDSSCLLVSSPLMISLTRGGGTTSLRNEAGSHGATWHERVSYTREFGINERESSLRASLVPTEDKPNKYLYIHIQRRASQCEQLAPVYGTTNDSRCAK